jgi:arylsulfatase A-like enzyme
VNPTYHLRETKETITPQGMTWDTGKYLGDGVETFYEAVHRVRGKWDPATKQGAVTASINEPCSRGAGHSTLEREMLVSGDAIRAVARENKEDTNPRWKAEGQEGCYRYSGTDMQGMAQALLLFDNDETPPPTFTYHEFSLNDSVGHDYGPHSDAVRDSLIETDKRINKILATLDRKGLFETTLFVVTTDHGMAPINVDLAADQIRAVPDAGIKSVTTMPLVYLLDMDVIVAAAPDGRTVTVTVLDNDADTRGENKPVAGARVEVVAPHARVVGQATTDAYGVAGRPLPADLDPVDLVVAVHHDDYNTRHLWLNGENVVEDPRSRLYQS